MAEWIVEAETLEELENGFYAIGAELVRCKDCKHTKTDGCGAIYCKVWDRWEMPSDFYCADGERREDDGIH